MSTKIRTIKEALNFLLQNYAMSPLSYSSDNSWYNLVSDSGIGCLLETDHNNTTFTLCFTLPYGTFKYTTMHISHLGKASDAGVDRLLQLYDQWRLLNDEY